MDNFNFKKYLAEGKIHQDLTENLGIELPKVTSQKANAKITNARTFAEFILDTWNTIATEENESVSGLQDLKIAKEKLEKVAKMKDEGEPVAENARTEAKEFSFIFNYNTDEDDIEYIQNLLKKAGVNATAEAGIDSEEMVVKAANAIELRKAKKAIQADGFDINESVVTKGKQPDKEIEKADMKKMKVSELKAKIKEQILAELSLSEAEEDVDVNVDVEDEVDVDVEADDIEIERPATKVKVKVGLSPEEELIQDSLKAAMDAANQLGNDKLADQIGNTITFFTREYVVGQNND